jgi:4-hydroxy-2-oxoheptanedioate aldolase
MPFSNTLKAALRRGEKTIGLWLTLGSFTATEIAARAGFDWLLIDMEHTVASEAEVLGHLRAAMGGTAEPMVRIPWNDAVVVKRVLDIGVRSILVPYVQNADEARRAVAATRYPPDGIRGYSGMSRANDYARDKAYATGAASEIFLAVQVESPEAVANAGAIAAVEGIDGVFVGPNDLAANMGLVGQAGHAAVRDAVATVIAPIHAAGKSAGMLDFNVDGARRWFELGFDFIGIGSDTSLLAAAVNGLVKAHRPG